MFHKVRIGLTKKAEPRRICDVNRDSGTERATRRWLRRLVRHQNPHNKLKPVIAKLSAASCSPRETGASFLFKAAKTSVTNSNQKLSNRNLAASPAAAEPPKAQLRPFLIAERNGGTQSRPARKASSLYYHLGTADLFLAEVNLDTNSVENIKKIAPELHGQNDIDESIALRDACVTHPRVLAELKKFKLPEHLEVACDPWPYGRDSEKHLPRYVQVSPHHPLIEIC